MKLVFFMAVWVSAVIGVMGCATTDQPAVPTARYALDAERSSVTFTIAHNGRPLEGRFGVVNGSFTPPAPSGAGQIHAAVAAGSVDTAIALRDLHLRTGDFFAVSRYPAVTFVGDVTQADTLVAEGELTLLGVTQPLTVTLEPIADVEDGSAHRCRFTIQRSVFGMTNGLSNGSIGDEVTLDVELYWTTGIESVDATP